MKLVVVIEDCSCRLFVRLLNVVRVRIRHVVPEYAVRDEVHEWLKRLFGSPEIFGDLGDHVRDLCFCFL